MMNEPLMKSKFLKKSISLNTIYDEDNVDHDESDDDESDDDESDDDNNEYYSKEATFIIDSTPNNSMPLKSNKKSNALSSELKSGIELSGYLGDKTSYQAMQTLDQMTIKNTEKQLMEKTVLKPGFEQQYCIKPFRQSKRLRKKMNREEAAKTAGTNWFNMPATELNEQRKNDLMVLNMRNSLDPKRFYKKSEHKNDFPKYFQVGTVVDSPADFYHSRVPKKLRKQTLVDELLADAEFKKRSKKKYIEAIAKNPYYIKMKRKKEKQRLKQKGIIFGKKYKKNKKDLRKKQSDE